MKLILSLVSMLALMTIGQSPTPTPAPIQSKERMITLQRFTHEPFVARIKVKGKDREFGQPFTEDSDWVKGLAIEIKNRQPKPIVFISMHIIFLETGNPGPAGLLYQMHIGKNPKDNTSNTEKSIFLIQNDTLTYSLSDHDHTVLTSFLSRKGHNIADLTLVRLSINYVLFSDDTMWGNGSDYEPDPSTRTGFRRIK